MLHHRLSPGRRSTPRLSPSAARGLTRNQRFAPVLDLRSGDRYGALVIHRGRTAAACGIIVAALVNAACSAGSADSKPNPSIPRAPIVETHGTPTASGVGTSPPESVMLRTGQTASLAAASIQVTGSQRQSTRVGVTVRACAAKNAQAPVAFAVASWSLADA